MHLASQVVIQEMLSVCCLQTGDLDGVLVKLLLVFVPFFLCLYFACLCDYTVVAVVANKLYTKYTRKTLVCSRSNVNQDD